jgi:hypothetical protein
MIAVMRIMKRAYSLSGSRKFTGWNGRFHLFRRFSLLDGFRDATASASHILLFDLIEQRHEIPLRLMEVAGLLARRVLSSPQRRRMLPSTYSALYARLKVESEEN